MTIQTTVACPVHDSFRVQQVAGFDGVRARRRVRVAARIHLRHVAGRLAAVHRACEHPARLVREAVEAVRDDRAVLIA